MALGVDAVEFDVTLTGDGGLILAHDLTVTAQITADRGAAFPGDPLYPYAGKRWLDLSLAQVATLDAGGRRPVTPFEESFSAIPGTAVPTLEQVCDFVRSAGASTTLSVELKTDPSWPDGDVKRLADGALRVLAWHGLARQARILGFDWRVLAAVDPGVPRVALVEPKTWVPGSAWLGGLDPVAYGAGAGAGGWLGCVAAARDAGAAWLSPWDGMVGAELVAACRREGLGIIVWTVNEPARMAELARLGVDGIVSDRPDLLRRVLQSLGCLTSCARYSCSPSC
jgi:glycerophosphoryl diester phosphodiesterase